MRPLSKTKRKPQPDLHQLARIEKGIERAARFTENIRSPYVAIANYAPSPQHLGSRYEHHYAWSAD